VHVGFHQPYANTVAVEGPRSTDRRQIRARLAVHFETLDIIRVGHANPGPASDQECLTKRTRLGSVRSRVSRTEGIFSKALRFDSACLLVPTGASILVHLRTSPLG